MKIYQTNVFALDIWDREFKPVLIFVGVVSNLDGGAVIVFRLVFFYVFSIALTH